MPGEKGLSIMVSIDFYKREKTIIFIIDLSIVDLLLFRVPKEWMVHLVEMEKRDKKENAVTSEYEVDQETPWMEFQVHREHQDCPESLERQEGTVHLVSLGHPARKEISVVVVKIAYQVREVRREIAVSMVILACQVRVDRPENGVFPENQVWMDYQDLWDHQDHRYIF